MDRRERINAVKYYGARLVDALNELNDHFPEVSVELDFHHSVDDDGYNPEHGRNPVWRGWVEFDISEVESIDFPMSEPIESDEVESVENTDQDDTFEDALEEWYKQFTPSRGYFGDSRDRMEKAIRSIFSFRAGPSDV